MADKIIITSNASPDISDDLWPRRLILEIEPVISIEDNTTTLNYVLKVDGTHEGAYAYMTYIYEPCLRWNLNPYSLEFDNIHYLHVEAPEYEWEENELGTFKVTSGEVLNTGSIVLQHSVDGTFPYTIFANMRASLEMDDRYSIDGIIEWNAEGTNNDPTINLAVIPRASKVTCTTVEVGRNPTIAINSPSPAFTHTLRYEFGSLTGTIATGVKGGNYNNWSIPSSFLNEITNDKYGEGIIYCDTYNGSTLNGTESCTFRVNVSSQYAPNISPTIKDDSARSLALTGDENKIIQYYNTVTYDIGAFTATGSTITSCEISCGNQTATTATGTLKNVESNEFNITVTDSRGFTTVSTIYKTLVPYVKLTAKLKLESMDTNGTGSVSITGNLFRGSFGLVDNNPVISYRYKAESGDWSAWQEVVYSITNDSYRTEIQFQGLDYQETYLFEAKAVDELMTVETEQLVVRCMPVYDWNDEDFQFNVPVIIHGDLTVTGTITGTGSPDTSDPVAQAADYVVETGTSDIWTYRKWNSGAAECWGTIAPVSISITGTWGALYIKDDAIPRVYYPFEFIDVPVVSMSLYNTTGNCWSYTGTQGSALMTPAFGLARGTSGSVTTGAQITAIGRWK